MVTFRALALFVAVSVPATAALGGPFQALGTVPGPSVVPVQDRFLPRFFGREDQGAAQPADMAVRLDQLETQVRNLTGQVEELTFALRRLEAAMASGQAPVPPQAGPGAPARNLAVPDPSQRAAAGGSGPVDLSALNQGAPAATIAPQSLPEPARTDALANVRQLQSSGRYAMAAEEARQVLVDNPTGPVAGEARYLLGEALLAQGDYREAANLFLENYTSDPNGARAPASLVKLGASLNNLGEREAACSSLEELFSVYPNVDGALRAEAERQRQAADCV